MFSIDPTDPTPVEAQIARTVRAAVEAGALAGGDALPTVRQLAVQLRVSANAVERGYAQLAREGLLLLRPGQGYAIIGGEISEARAAYDSLAALEDDFLRAAAALGFTLDDVIIHLDSRRSR